MLNAVMCCLESTDDNCAVSPCVSQTVMKKLEDATNNTKTWKHKVAEHEGLLRLIQPGNGTLQHLPVWVSNLNTTSVRITYCSLCSPFSDKPITKSNLISQTVHFCITFNKCECHRCQINVKAMRTDRYVH